MPGSNRNAAELSEKGLVCLFVMLAVWYRLYWVLHGVEFHFSSLPSLPFFLSSLFSLSPSPCLSLYYLPSVFTILNQHQHLKKEGSMGVIIRKASAAWISLIFFLFIHLATRSHYATVTMNRLHCGLWENAPVSLNPAPRHPFLDLGGSESLQRQIGTSRRSGFNQEKGSQDP